MFQDPYNYEPLDPDYDGPPVVGIRENAEKGLPAVLFRCSDTDVPVQAGVSNTNYQESARCVYITADSYVPVHMGASKALRVLALDISILNDSEMKKIVSDIEKDIF